MRRILALLFMLVAAPIAAQQTILNNIPGSGNLYGTTCPPTANPGTPGTLYTCTGTGAIYTWTGSAWVAAGGGSGAPTDATYITQTPNGSLSAEQALSALSTGMARITTTTGVVTSVTDAQSYYNVLVNGIVAGDVDTAGANSTALLALLSTVNTAGGGTIYFPPGTYRFDSQILLPNNGGMPQPDQNNIRLTGAGGGGAWYFLDASILDLRYTAVDGNAKIETRGRGTLVLDHLTIKDGGASNVTPLVHSTNTTVLIDKNTFYGSGNVAQDAIVLGGVDTVLGSDVDSPFQGYNTRITGNVFRNLNRGLYGLNYVNAVVFSNNSFIEDVGTIAVELDGSNGGGQYDHGNSFNDNTFEMNVYINAFKMTWAEQNTFIANQMFDADGDVTGYFNMSTNGYRNFILCGNPDFTTTPILTGDSTAVLTTGILCTNGQSDPIGGRGPISSSLPYGLAVTGTYDSTKDYPGPLIVAAQFDPAKRVSIAHDGTANETVIDSRQAPSTMRPIHFITSQLNAEGGTITSTSPIINATQTWNFGANTFTGALINITNTASDAASRLLDVQVGGTTRFYVQGGPSTAAMRFNFGNVSTNDEFLVKGTGEVRVGTNAVGARWVLAHIAGTYNVGLNLASDGALTFNSTTNLDAGTRDLSLFRDAADTFGQRRGTNAQVYNLYNTYTSSTSNEYFNQLWSSNVLHLGTNKGSGGGTARVMQIDYGGTTTSAISVPITSGTVTFGGSTTANYYIGNGTGLTVANVGANSCGTTAATVAGGSSSFEVTVGATSGTQCRVTFPTAAPTRWNCAASNTTTAALVRVANVDTTNADLLGVFTAADVIAVVCTPR